MAFWFAHASGASSLRQDSWEVPPVVCVGLKGPGVWSWLLVPSVAARRGVVDDCDELLLEPVAEEEPRRCRRRAMVGGGCCFGSAASCACSAQASISGSDSICMCLTTPLCA